MDKVLEDMITNCTTVMCHEVGHEIVMKMPRVHHLAALSTYLQSAVFKYIRNAEKRNRKVEYLIDIGAHVGLWTIPFLLMFPDADILAIEPSKYNIPFLEYNIKRFAPDRVEIRKLALGNSRMKCTIACPTPVQKRSIPKSGDTGLISAFGLSEKWREEVEVEKLDNLVLKRVDWIKIDTEGSELLVLRGAEETINRDRPILQIEMKDSNQQMAGLTVWDLLKYITEDLRYVSIGEIRGDLIFLPQEVGDTDIPTLSRIPKR